MKKIHSFLIALSVSLVAACNQGFQLSRPFLQFDDLSSITAPGNHTISGICAPDGSQITINCGGTDSQTTCVEGGFSAANVQVTAVPASCTGTIVGPDNTTVTTQNPVESGNTIVSVPVDYTGPDHIGSFEFDFDLLDDNGDVLANDGSHTVTLSLIDLSAGEEVLFTGDFLVGDDLSSAVPSNASGLDYTTFVQPYVSGILEHDQTIVLEKREWAEANGRFYQVYDASPKAAVELGVALTVSENSPQQMAVLPVYTQFSYDNHSAPSPAVGIPHVFEQELTFGSMLSVSDPNAVTYSTLNSQCSGSYRSKDDAFDTVIAYILDGEMINSGFTAASGLLDDAIAGAFGVTSTFSGLYGTTCQDRLLDYHRFNSFIPGQSIIVIGGTATGQEVMRFKLNAFRSF